MYSFKSAEDVIKELSNAFTLSGIHNFMDITSLKDYFGIASIEDFNKLIYLKSATDEVYGGEERRLINVIDRVYMTSESYKFTIKGIIPMRCIFVDLTCFSEGIYYAVLFMKIIIKAFEGLNFFVFNLSEGIHFGVNVFGGNPDRNCIISETKHAHEVLDCFDYIPNTNPFIDFYNGVLSAIKPVNRQYADYDERALKRMGVNLEYIEALKEIEQQYLVDLSNHINRYLDWFYDEKENDSFIEMLEFALEELSYIKSAKINTMELLFEAEEIERMSVESENRYLEQLRNEQKSSVNDENIQTKDYSDVIENYGSDPDKIIKLLKQKRGL